MASASATPRVAYIDALRGFAVFGLFMVHMSEMFELYWANPVPTLVPTMVFGAFAGKAYAILALCFGFSFYALGESAIRRGEDFAPRFARRLWVLLIIGFAHCLVYRGDIITVLAPLGFVLMPFFKLHDRRVLIGFAAFFFCNPFVVSRIIGALLGSGWGLKPMWSESDPGMGTYLREGLGAALYANLTDGNIFKWTYFIEAGRITQMLGLFLCGLMLGRANWFGKDTPWRQLGLVFVLALGGLGLASWAEEATKAALPNTGLGAQLRLLTDGWQSLAGVVLWVVATKALWQTSWRGAISWLTQPGRMTLTLYFGQSLLFVPFFYHFGLDGWSWMTQPQCLMLGLVSFAVQAVLAHWWLARFAYGPLEWVWRAATLGNWNLPFRKA